MTNDEQRPAILVADSQPESLRAISFSLEQSGYSVLIATGGCAALCSARVHRPELILLDISLRDLDGLEVCRCLKQDAETRPIPVIFLAAADDRHRVGAGLRAGGADCIDKPYDADPALARVRTHLELTQLRRCVRDRVHGVD